MEKFHPRSALSCKPTQSMDQVIATLRDISDSPVIRKLYQALGTRELFLVGGSVRDAFFTQVASDLDVATSLAAGEVRTRCETQGLRVVDTGIQHGTVLVLIDDVHIEVTTFRHPADRATQINARDITIDLSGRDFTVNALAFDLTSQELLDPFAGLADLEKGILRAVGDPIIRLTEDPLRILRMVRFGPARGRVIDSDTLRAAKSLAPKLAQVSVERIRQELEEILLSEYPAAGFVTLENISALEWTVPELIPAVGFEQNRYHIHDVFDHTMAVLDRAPQERILRWAALFHDIGKPHTLSVDSSGARHFYLHELVSTDLSWKRMEQLKFSHDDMKRISAIVRHHMRPLNCGPAGVRRLIRDLGDNLELWRAFKDADSSPKADDSESAQMGRDFDAMLEVEKRKMMAPSYGKLAVNGEDLKAIGIAPGPGMGRILKQLEEIIIEDPQKNEREALIARAKKLST